jgi:hypothetical protein
MSPVVVFTILYFALSLFFRVFVIRSFSLGFQPGKVFLDAVQAFFNVF